MTLLLLVSWMVSGLLAADHSLHQSLHTEAGHSDHVCLSVLLSGSQVEPVLDFVLVPDLVRLPGLPWQRFVLVEVSDFDPGCESGRGPPRFLFF